MANDRAFLLFCSIVSIAGAIALGLVVDDWRFSAFVAAVFAIPLGATAMQGSRIIRFNAVLPRRRRRSEGGRP